MLLIVEKTCSKLLSYFKMHSSIALSTSIVLSSHLYYLPLLFTSISAAPKRNLYLLNHHSPSPPPTSPEAVLHYLDPSESVYLLVMFIFLVLLPEPNDIRLNLPIWHDWNTIHIMTFLLLICFCLSKSLLNCAV